MSEGMNTLEGELKTLFADSGDTFSTKGYPPFLDFLWDCQLTRDEYVTLEGSVVVDELDGPRTAVFERIRGEIRYWIATDRDSTHDRECEIGVLASAEAAVSLCREFLSERRAIRRLASPRSVISPPR